MCGRYVITSPPDAIRRLFGYPEQPNFPPRYNVAPTQPVPVVRQHGEVRQFTLMRWGLLPSWVKDPQAFTLLINARAETVNDKPAFRNAMRRRRCLLPADGFYEWRQAGARKQPFFIRRRDSAPFAFAGLWETWAGPGGEEIDTVAIITVPANAALHPLHHRMPVILPPPAFAPWLDPRADLAAATGLLTPAPDENLEFFTVSEAVNKVANDDPRNVVPLAAPAPDAVPEPAPRLARRRAAAVNDAQGSLF